MATYLFWGPTRSPSHGLPIFRTLVPNALDFTISSRGNILANLKVTTRFWTMYKIRRSDSRAPEDFPCTGFSAALNHSYRAVIQREGSPAELAIVFRYRVAIGLAPGGPKPARRAGPAPLSPLGTPLPTPLGPVCQTATKPPGQQPRWRSSERREIRCGRRCAAARQKGPAG